MRLRSSRTLPGQECESREEIASGVKELPGFLRLRKCSAKATISSGRSRSGGTRKLKLAEAMEKILPKAARGHGGIEILIGGGDDADIDFDLAVTAQTVEWISIQNTQQLYLRVQLQFADFIEEKRALVGHFE